MTYGSTTFVINDMLVLAGHAFETFRFWEAIDVLSIPILVRPDHNVSAVVDRARVDAFSHFTKLDGKFVVRPSNHMGGVLG